MIDQLLAKLATYGISESTLIVVLVAFILGGLFLGGGHRHVRRAFGYGYRHYRRYRYRDY